MLGKVLILSMILLGFILIFSYMTDRIEAQLGPFVTYTENTVTTCTQNVCTTEINPLKTYFYNDSLQTWQRINESLTPCSGAWCSGDYGFRMRVAANSTVILNTTKGIMSYDMLPFLTRKLNLTNISLIDNVLTFQNVFPNIDLQYVYLSEIQKENIIFKSNPGFIPNNIINLSFTYSGNTGFRTLPASVCDSSQNCTVFRITQNSSNINIYFDGRWMNSGNRVFPVILDPSFQVNDSAVEWEGYITKVGATNTIANRTSFNNPSNCGDHKRTGSVTIDNNYSCGIEWDLSNIPKNANITNVKVRLRSPLAEVGTGGNSNFTIQTVQGRNLTYDQSSGGDQNFDDALNNGTRITGWFNVTVGTAVNYTLLQNGINDVQDHVNKGYFWLMSLRTWPDTSVAARLEKHLTTFTAAAFNNRPTLYVTYTTGDWNYTCANNLTITTPFDMGGFNVYIRGNGTFTVSGVNINRTKNITIEGSSATNKCYVTAKGGWFIR